MCPGCEVRGLSLAGRIAHRFGGAILPGWGIERAARCLLVGHLIGPLLLVLIRCRLADTASVSGRRAGTITNHVITDLLALLLQRQAVIVCPHTSDEQGCKQNHRSSECFHRRPQVSYCDQVTGRCGAMFTESSRRCAAPRPHAASRVYAAKALASVYPDSRLAPMRSATSLCGYCQCPGDLCLGPLRSGAIQNRTKTCLSPQRTGFHKK